MKQKVLIPSLLIATIITIGAMSSCGRGQTTGVTPTETPVHPTETLVPIPTPIIPPTMAPITGTTRLDEVSGSGAITGSSEIRGGEERTNSKLDALKSYHAELRVTFSGNDPEGQPQNGTMSFLVTRDNATRDTEMVIVGDGPLFENEAQVGETKFYLIDGASYIVIAPSDGGEPQCMEIPSHPDQNAPDLSDTLGEFTHQDMTLVEEGAVVNGVATDHYRTEDTKVFRGGEMVTDLEKVEADVWVAQKEGYVVKIVATMRGKSLPVGNKEVSGAVDVNYNVMSIDEPVQITLPSVCETQP